MIFITGGVRSGKSAFAEKFARQLGEEKTLYYVATGVSFDEEMEKTNYPPSARPRKSERPLEHSGNASTDSFYD